MSFLVHATPPNGETYPTYSASTAYVTGNVVHYNGNTYIAIVKAASMTGVTPTAKTTINNTVGNMWFRVLWELSSTFVTGPSLTTTTLATSEIALIVDRTTSTTSGFLQSGGVATTWTDGTYATNIVVLYGGNLYIANGSISVGQIPNASVGSSTNNWIPYWVPWLSFAYADLAYRNSDPNYTPSTISPGGSRAETYTANSTARLNGFNVFCFIQTSINASITTDGINGWFYKADPLLTFKRGDMACTNVTTPTEFYMLSLVDQDWNANLLGDANWVQSYKSGVSVLANNLRVHTSPDLNIWRTGTNASISSAPIVNTTGNLTTTWRRARVAGLACSDQDTYSLNEVIYDTTSTRNTRAITSGLTNTNNIPTDKNVLTTGVVTEWVPAYVSGTGSIGDAVFLESTYYVRWNLSGTSAPVSPNTSGDGWVPIWDAASTYSSGHWVWYNGSIYQALVNITTPSATSPTADPTVWRPATWSAAVAYKAFTTVYYNGVRYGCIVDQVAGSTPTLPATGTATWVPLWMSTGTDAGAHQAGDFVYYNNVIYRAVNNTSLSSAPLTANSTASGWVQVWMSTWAYSAYVSVWNAGTIFWAEVAQTAGSTPVTPCTSSSSWIPQYSNVTQYSVGQLVANNGLSFIAYSAPIIDSTPVTNTTVLTGWIPVYRLNWVTYDLNTYVYHNNVFYIAYSLNSLSTTAPVPVRTNASGWMPVWQLGTSYSTNNIIWHADSSQLCTWSESTSTTSASPVNVNITGYGWMPIYSGSVQYYEGQWVSYNQKHYVATRSLLGTTPALTVISTTASTLTSWAQRWLSGGYTLNTIVVHNSYQNGLSSNWYIYRAGTSAAPSATPSTFQTTFTYKRGMIVRYSSVDYCCTAANVAASTTYPGTAGSFWTPVWKLTPTAPYTTGNLVAHGPFNNFKLVGTSDGTSQPDQLSTSTIGWVRTWLTNNFHLQNQVAESGDLVYTASRDVVPGEALPASNTAWSSSWNSTSTYPSSSVVAYNGVLYTTLQSQEQNVVPQFTTTSTTGWLPVYDSSSSYSNQMVAYNNVAYYAAGAVTGVTPTSTNTSGSGWTPVWQSGTYTSSQYVYKDGRVYFQAGPTSTSSTPSTSTTSTTGWVPVWVSGTYAANSTVYHSNTYYSAATSTSATPGTAPSTLSGWIPQWTLNSTYTQNTFIYYASGYYCAAGSTALGTTTPGTDSTIWAPQWVSGQAVSSGDILFSAATGRLYIATSAITAEVNTVAPTVNTSGTGLMAIWVTGGTYSQGEYVYHQGFTYIASGSSMLSTSAPAFTVMNTEGWVPVWVAGVDLTQGSYVYTSGAALRLSANVSAVDNTTAPTSSQSPLYQAASNYTLGSTVQDAISGLEFIAATPVGSNVAPSLNISAVDGWVPIYKAGTSFPVGSYVFHNGQYFTAVNSNVDLSSTTPTTTISSPDGWVLAWNEGITSISKNTFAAKDGNLFYSLTDVSGSNLTPSLSNTVGTGFVPVFVQGTPYGDGSVVYDTLTGNAYVSGTTSNTLSLTSNATSKEDDWIKFWKTGDSNLSNGSVVFSGGRYFKALGSNVPLLAGSEPTPYTSNTNSWVPYWSNASFSSNNFVIDDSDNLFYTDNAIPSVSNIVPPSTPNTVGNGWLPVWKAQPYQKGQYVHDIATGRKFIAQVDGLTDAPTAENTTGTGWMPVWKQNDPYNVSNHVYHNGREYIAWGDSEPLSTTQPVLSVSSPGGWIPKWTESVSASNSSLVAHSGKLYSSLRSLTAVNNSIAPSQDTSGLNWAVLWQSDTYQQGQVALKDGRQFVALTSITTNDIPMTNNKTPLGWVAKFDIADDPLYEQGDYVFSNNRTFLKYGTGPALALPTANTTSVDSFVPVWHADDQYVKSNYAVFNEKLYFAATNI